jgi:4-aminobutyrate aminotransferase
MACIRLQDRNFYCEEHAKIAQKLSSIVPENFKTFFINSSAEAVENAIKIAYKKMGPLPGVSCNNAFHGRTLGALSFTFSKPIQKANFPELPVKKIKFCINDNDLESDSIEKLLKENKIAFILSEVIQGEGGIMLQVNSLSQILKIYKPIWSPTNIRRGAIWYGTNRQMVGF